MFAYSNGWGHLVMSVVMIATGLCLIFFEPNNSAMQGIGIALVIGVNGAWFVTASAKSFAQQMQSQIQQISDAPPKQPIQGE